MELNDNEKEYYYDLLDAMKLGVIDSNMKEHLKESKIDNKISDERAKELEKLARDEQISAMEELKNDSERRYYKEYIKMMDDGIISESERTNLNNKKSRLSISDSRAKEIEELYNNNNKIAKSENTLTTVNEKNIISDNKNSQEVKEAEIVEKDKQIGILKRWKYLNKTKFINFHIFNILIILAFEIYFFIRLKGTFNNPKPAPTTSFEKFADMIKSGASTIYEAIVPDSIVTGIEMANNIIFNVIIVVLLLVLLIVLFILYTYSARILSVMIAKTCKQVDFFYRTMAILIPVSISITMVIFTEWDHMTDRRAIAAFKKENTALINKEDYLRVFDRNNNIENNLALIYESRYQTTKTAEFDRLISSMINSFEKRNKLEMNNTNFSYIIGNLVPAYNQSIKNIPQYAQSYNKIIGNAVSNSFKNRINYLIDNTNYIGAYITISSIPNINMISEKEYLNNFKQSEYQKLLENIMNNFEVMINEEMNIDNYNLIYKEFVFVFDKTLGINQNFWYKVKNTDIKEGIENFGTKAGELVHSIIQSVKNFIGASKGEERNLYEDKDIFVFDTKDIYFDEVGKNFMIQRMNELRKRLDIKRDKYLLDLDHRLINASMTIEEMEKAIPTIVHYSEAKKDDVANYYQYWNYMRHKRELGLDQLKFELPYREKLNALKSEYDDLLKKDIDYTNYMYIMDYLENEIVYYYTNLSDTQYRRDLQKDIILNIDERDKKRHEYLKTLSQNLTNSIENKTIGRKEALEIANQIVHYSDEKIDKDGLVGLLPSFLGGDTTYYKYWNDIRNDLINKINRKLN
ncbi:hypothetical protein [Brachyspira hampsonii]|uniref:hypothetical protein n=1 Tax=Brachyspira hampsonii TaxID=1287055 RepID=UPI001CA5E1A4|nr:hypothetical protein [Brachyspira hampsonii]MBW5390137.1 hypothetical protein [Brachyspira hampsonii]